MMAHVLTLDADGRASKRQLDAALRIAALLAFPWRDTTSPISSRRTDALADRLVSAEALAATRWKVMTRVCRNG
jgi:hypothetical protein